MSTKEDEIRDRLLILETKDREIKEREIILEQRIKLEYEKLNQDKVD